MAGEAEASRQASELDEAIRAIRDRVRAQYPEGTCNGVTLPGLTPVLHARDAAQGTSAAIGTVNPRRPGALNGAIQAIKKAISRGLAWHVREQVAFNRAAVAGFDAVIEALNENNRALVDLAGRIQSSKTELAGELEETRRYVRFATDAIEAIRADLASLRGDMAAQRADVAAIRRDVDAGQNAIGALQAGHDSIRADLAGAYREFADLRSAWQQKAAAFDEQLLKTESYLLRMMADLRAAFEMRLGQTSEEIQRRLWGDMAKTRLEYEAIIHRELRIVRQQAAAFGFAADPPPEGRPAAVPPLDWAMFADRFRGTEEFVRERQRAYVPLFEKHEGVLDIGCGRGEFLELMRESGVPARGIETSSNMVAICRAKGLDAVAADAFQYLPSLPEESLDGVFCAHVVEHLPAERLPSLLLAAAAKLKKGGIIAIETPNPECLAIFASHFYLDPTHVRPVPPPLLAFYLEEAGFGQIEQRRLSPAKLEMASVESLPPDFRDTFFDGLDYAMIAYRL